MLRLLKAIPEGDDRSGLTPRGRGPALGCLIANLPVRRCTRCLNDVPCPVHTRQRSSHGKQWRSLYATRWWKDSRLEFIAAKPTCCDAFGVHGPLVPTWTADHIKSHRGDLQLFMDRAALITTDEANH
jgi:hypothetical protein